MATWHIVTPEYPPEVGGVAGYAAQVAGALAETGDQVHVWTGGSASHQAGDSQLHLHRCLDWSRWLSLWRAGRQLDRYHRPRLLLVQWVPHGYSRIGVNFAVCAWVRWRKLRGDRVQIVAHEAYADPTESWRQHMAAVAQRLMAAVLFPTAEIVWVTIPAWTERLRRFCPFSSIEYRCLPVPSNVPVTTDKAALPLPTRIKRPNGRLIGHFGTYPPDTSKVLAGCFLALLASDDDRTVLLMGRGSSQFRADFVEEHPEFEMRIQASGLADPGELSAMLSACDVMLQPYSDGVSGRRTTLMASIAHGRATVTTTGTSSESFWTTSGAVAAVRCGETDLLIEATERLLEDEVLRRSMGEKASQLYAARFHVAGIVRRLRESRRDIRAC